jgi:hypothetical protein
VLLGNKTERQLQKQRELAAALDETNRALIEQVYAEEDRQASVTRRAGLMDRLDVVRGLRTERQLQMQRELSEATDDATRALIRQVYAEEDAATAREKAVQDAKTAVGNALSTLQRSVDAQRKTIQAQQQVAQEQVQNLNSIFSTLKSGIQSLYQSSETASRFNAQTATSFLNTALATAQASGYLPDSTELADAVNAAVSGINQSVYASEADAEFARMVLAGTLGKLKDLSGAQLDTAEALVKNSEDQLTALDDLLKSAQDQIDAVNGVNVSVMSVSAAMGALATAIQNQAAAQAASAAAAAAAAARPTNPYNTNGQYSNSDLLQPYSTSDTPELRNAKVAAQTGITVTSNDSAMTAAAKLLYLSATGGGAPGDLFNQVSAQVGGSIPNALNWDGSREALEQLRTQYSFAVGTNYVPYDMVAQIHEGEAIVPKAYNPAAGAQMSDDLLAELIVEVQRLQSAVRDGTVQQRRTAEAVNGNPDQPMLVQTV